MAEYIVDPNNEFNSYISYVTRKVDDLTIPLQLISRQWYKGNRSIFTLAGPGQYEDLSDNYWPRKQKKWGFIYPILKASGKLEKSITKPDDKNAYSEIVNKKNLFLGVTTKDMPYATAHQFGYKYIPKRQYLFTGAEQIRPEGHKKSLSIYKSIIEDYVTQVGKGKK